MTSQKISPHLWFDKDQALVAANFYVDVFPNTKITYSSTLKNTPGGDCNIVSFDMDGFNFLAMDAGPAMFKITPAISFIVNFKAQDVELLNKAWAKLIEGGNIRMPLEEYFFCKRFGWVEDRFGVSWQLFLLGEDVEKRSFVIPSLMFVGDVCGKAEEASNFYMSVFSNSKEGMKARYGKDAKAPEKEENLMYSDFMIANQWFAANDSAHPHDFTFTEAVSLVVDCDDQAELDHYWEKLSFVPQAEQCGWLRDKYGVAWQIEPKIMHKMLKDNDQTKVARVTEAFLKMKKFDIQTLVEAYEGTTPKRTKTADE